MALLAVSGLLVFGALVTLAVCHLVAEVDRQTERASHRRLLAELHRHEGYPSVTDQAEP